MIRTRYFIEGVVQGVGFRPFIYKIATSLSLTGYVKNSSNGVDVEVQGCIERIKEFDKRLIDELPLLARIDKSKTSIIKNSTNEKKFIILDSDNSCSKTTLVSPDICVCKECLEDLKNGRFKEYFATNCTNCGPRYSILKTLPYDRKNTSMEEFDMCDDCKNDYNDPQSRRYHAQPISCTKCGPKLSSTIEKTAKHIKDGKIVAIKGIGGFHIVCDASNDEVIAKIREFKNRPTKPLAIMCKDLDEVKKVAILNQKEQTLIESIQRPIVVLEKTKSSNISELVAPNIDRIGCMLPYTPLHYMLFEHLDVNIVATSANLGGEPIITTKEMIEQKLPFVDFILDHNRDIVNAIDDSVIQVADNRFQTLRLARGYTPKVVKLPKKSNKNILSLGANQKSTISICYKDNIVNSGHIGDLDSLMSIEYFERTIETFNRFYDFKPDVIVHDKHNGYESTKWARKQNIKLCEVQHHLAHIYAAKAEFGLSGDYLGFSFDGTGYGGDEALWGGEVFVGEQRKYHFKPIKLLGGEKAIKEPWRVALSILFERYTLDEVLDLELNFLKSIPKSNIKLLHQSYSKDINAPLSSSVGRLFDAVACFGDLLSTQSYEGEAGLMCEMVYDKREVGFYEYKIVDNVIDIEFDFYDPNIVSKFINTLVEIVVKISETEFLDVILSGGVFQNKTLLELICSRLKESGINYFSQEQTPINDGGISLGQIYFLATSENCT